MVTEDSKGYIFYEAKFREAPLSASRIREEIHQVKNTGLKCYRYGFVSRSGFDAEPGENMIFISLEDLYK